MTHESDETSPGHSRRALFQAGAIGGVAAVLAATVGSRPAEAAGAIEVDTSFPDFSVPPINGSDDSLVKIQKKGVLVVGTSNDWPYSFLDPKANNAWAGLDAEIITMAAKMLKIAKVDVQTVTFDGLVPGTLGGRFDMVGDSIHYTKARSKVVNFCFPTYYYAETMAVAKGNPLKLGKLTDLKGHKVGTLLGTNYAEWIQAIPGVEFQGYKDWQQMMPELAIGRLDAVLYDQPVVAAQMKDHPEWKVDMVAEYEPHDLKNPSAYSTYVFRPGDIQLVTGFSSAIAWMEYNGEMKKILSKWGLTGYNN
ncbi:ABC transporter substrate-binding protein [Acidisphaera sp. L21]|uniref:ABC transporter substrate-binding protein n=1 Tax=Acidisphaera sp. L21 TaxID=1641851 RepID=UPI00131B3382|nr:ABC transporter substrate-binding protein [Acidisphaera sp. L21]